MGLFSSLFVILFNLKLRKHYFYREKLDEARAKLEDVQPYRIRIGRLLYYLPWLVWQIVVASFQVAKVVLHPKMPIDPALMRFKTGLPNTEARVILGNSITLTPGTITVQIEDDEFLVHALMDASQSGILDGSLPTEVAKLYEKKPGQVLRKEDIKISKSNKGAEV